MASLLSLENACYKRPEAAVKEDLEKFSVLLKKWAPAHNLVALGDLPYLWARHIQNSWQICPYLAPTQPIVDLGAGAGFPGIILAILGYGPLILIDKLSKRCLFLNEVIMQLGLKNVTIFQGHMQDYDFSQIGQDKPVQVVARGFAPLETICELLLPSWPYIHKGVFHKGAQAQAEIEQAQKAFSCETQLYPDPSLQQGHILELLHLSSKKS
ncbi:16S rRNA (guanine(527)-N(7))-methyltransferase RsmG [Alphaproteobacteria bacterium]|nr:16S rRNA (guanine(527)-N(7))-methyltransferase RsmG [Alphaproteobacteria bacterium]